MTSWSINWFKKPIKGKDQSKTSSNKILQNEVSLRKGFKLKYINGDWKNKLYIINDSSPSKKLLDFYFETEQKVGSYYKIVEKY